MFNKLNDNAIAAKIVKLANKLPNDVERFGMALAMVTGQIRAIKQNSPDMTSDQCDDVFHEVTAAALAAIHQNGGW